MPLFGQKTGFRARNAGMNEIKSGIPCSGYSDALLSVECFFLVKGLREVYKKNTHTHEMMAIRCDLLSVECFFFVKCLQEVTKENTHTHTHALRTL